jgi:hypothetical protein
VVALLLCSTTDALYCRHFRHLPGGRQLAFLLFGP